MTPTTHHITRAVLWDQVSPEQQLIITEASQIGLAPGAPLPEMITIEGDKETYDQDHA